MVLVLRMFQENHPRLSDLIHTNYLRENCVHMQSFYNGKRTCYILPFPKYMKSSCHHYITFTTTDVPTESDKRLECVPGCLYLPEAADKGLSFRSIWSYSQKMTITAKWLFNHNWCVSSLFVSKMLWLYLVCTRSGCARYAHAQTVHAEAANAQFRLVK